MSDLFSLPTELLQQIASFSTCSSVLNLLRVNRQLRNACNDRLVFQNLARRDLSYSPVGIYNTRLPCSETEFILASGSHDELVRLAFAAEKCVEAALAKDNSWTLEISKRSGDLDLRNWLPQMLVLKHSAALNMKPEAFLELQGRSHPRNNNTLLKKDFPTVNFIISCLLLHNLSCCVDSQEVKNPCDLFFEHCNTDPPITTEDGEEQESDSIDGFRQRVPNYGEFKDDFDLNQATALLPALILELAADCPQPLILEKLPVPRKIPFSSMLDIPALFQGHTNPPFSEWHTKKMVNAELLSGEWMGFYSDQRGGELSARHFDPPMRDININARMPPAEATGGRVAVIIGRESRGVDAHGEFMLEGYVEESGFVHMMKQYIVTRWSWSWFGRLTPFGIVGVWGGGYNNFGGYFWVWKREWCEMGFGEIE